MKSNGLKIFFLLIAGIMSFSHCANNGDQRIEEAQFLLDKAKFAEAVAKIRPVVTADPTNTEASFILASALLGGAVLGNNTTYLGHISRIQEDQASTEATPYSTFARLAPQTAGLADLNEARDILITLSTTAGVEASRKRDFYLQLYVARLFEISGVVTLTGAGSEDLLCNANHADALKDGVPDDFDPDAVTGAQSTRFDDNLAKINGDGVKAGLPTDFGLNDRITTITTDLANAGAMNQFLKDAFGDPAAPCTVPK